MAAKEKDIKECYSKNLKANLYQQQLLNDWDTIEQIVKFSLNFIHKITYSGRFKGSKLLEIGSGATVHYLSSASAVFKNIVQSDYVLDNCEELKRWHSGESSLDWSKFLNVAAKLEGYENDLENGRKILEARIRKSVKRVVKSDVLSNEVVPLDELTTPETRPPYDVVMACSCLEAASPDLDSFVANLKRICTLLRTGGGLILTGFENGGIWRAGNFEFNHARISLNEIKTALNLAGFGKLDLETLDKIEGNYYYEYDSFYCIAAEKL